MVKVFVIDDHYILLDGFNQLFDPETDDICVVGASTSVEEAIRLIPSLKVDVIILDLFIKMTDPVLNINSINKSLPGIPVLVLSGEVSLEWQLKMFRGGAKAYVSKEDNKDVLKGYILLVADGQSVIPDEILLQIKGKQKTFQKTSLDIQERELILSLVNGFTIKEIAERGNKSISLMEKTLRKARLKYNAQTTNELISILFHRKEIF